MGYCMSYRRALGRNGLFGDYFAAGQPLGLWGNTPFVGALETPFETTMIAGDLRRVELDQRDDLHLAAYAAHAGVTVEQAKAVLDAFFDGVPDSIDDCIHMRRSA